MQTNEIHSGDRITNHPPYILGLRLGLALKASCMLSKRPQTFLKTSALGIVKRILEKLPHQFSDGEF